MKNDKLLQDEEFAALIEQYDNAVVYEIVNLFEKDGEYRDRQSMREDPPRLVITDREGSEVEFKLTEELTSHLVSSLTQVSKGYHGYRKYIPREVREMGFRDRVKYELKNNTLKFVITVLSVLTILGIIIFNIIGG